ncbi:MAG: DUF1501 domain-containing protein [Pirellulales bacterium]
MPTRKALNSSTRASGDTVPALTRRHFFGECGLGVGKIALASLLTQGARATLFADGQPTGAAARPAPHFPAKVKNIIHLFMAGAPSQLELFDDKPVLNKHDGQPVPQELLAGQRYAFILPNSKLLGSQYRFSRHGQCGASLSQMLPNLGRVADQITIIKSLHTDQFNHAPAEIFLLTGSPLPGRPSLGSWVNYGLGSEAEDLPGFVVLSSGSGTSGGVASWSSGFLPTAYQGVPFRSQGDAVLHVSNPPGIDAAAQRDSLDLARTLNERRLAQVGDPEIATRISAYEMAFRMQTSAPGLMDLTQETAATLDAYNVKPDEPSFAKNCLLARRLVERGVRFVSVVHHSWDHHSDVAGGVRDQCALTDQPSAALVEDLKQRGLLDDTLVIWGGEFGRTPMVESNVSLKRTLGRDHHPHAFSMWMAGGGLKPGLTLGATDDLGFKSVEDPVHIHDLQATILHLLGLDHERLTYTHQGRNYRLTDVHGQVVRKILA